MIHSIISMDDIFFTENTVRTEYQKIGGGLLELNTVGGEKRVCRLHSTDPYLYLNRRYSPSTVFPTESRAGKYR